MDYLDYIIEDMIKIELMQATALRDDIDPEIANIARRYLGCIDGRQGAET